MLRDLFNDSAAVAMSRVAQAALGLAVHAMVTRILAPEYAGLYFFSLSLVLSMAGFVLFGAHFATVRRVSHFNAMNQQNQAKTSAGTLLLICLCGIAVGMLAGLSGGYEYLVVRVFDKPEAQALMAPILVWIGSVALLELLSAWLRGGHRVRLAAVIDGPLRPAVTALLLGVLLLSQTDASVLMVLWICTGAAGATVLAGWIVSGFQIRWGRLATWQRVKEEFKLALPMHATRIVNYLLVNSDILIVAAFSTASETALYGVASRLIALISFPLQVVNYVIQPRVSRLIATNSIGSLRRLLGVSATVAFIPGGTAVLVLIWMSPGMLSLLFGEYYAAAASILQVLLVGRFVNLAVGSSSVTLMMSGHERRLARMSIWVGAGTLCLAVFGGRNAGGLGVAAAISIGLIIQNIWTWSEVRRQLGIWSHPSFGMTLEAARSYLDGRRGQGSIK